MIRNLSLYKGKVKITFDDARHIFRDREGNHILSVTSATGMIDKSAALMGWSVKMMAEYLRQNWNLEKIKTEQDKLMMIDLAKKEYRKVKKEAADIGTEIHKFASDWIKGKKPMIPEETRVRNGAIAFMKWIKEEKIKPTVSEAYIYSQKYNYAGIMDMEGLDEGELVIGDFKSSKGIYNEMRYQLAGYWLAREEETGKKFKKGFIAQFGKETGDFHVLNIPRKEYLKDVRVFLAALAIKRREKELEYGRL